MGLEKGRTAFLPSQGGEFMILTPNPLSIAMERGLKRSDRFDPLLKATLLNDWESGSGEAGGIVE
jgi:hypothetical protein